jgi:hypothetical protein
MQIEFYRHIFENISNFMKIRLLETDFFHEEDQTHRRNGRLTGRRDKAKCHFRKFVNVPKKYEILRN